MKSVILAISILYSTSTFARQYFQCSTYDTHSTEVMVVNVQTPQAGTVFISSGMQNDESERALFKMSFEKVEGKNHLYKVITDAGVGSLYVPSNVLGHSSDSVDLILALPGYRVTYSCFARMYDN